MSAIAIAVAGVGIGGALLASGSTNRATREATEASGQASAAAIEEQRRQFNQTRQDLLPFTEAGTDTLGSQLDLIGVNGQEAQQLAIENLRQSPEYLTLVQEGEEAILQNASATGGLRGGNVQRSLAQFRPQILSDLINQQYERLGGISRQGQASAAQVAQIGAGTAANIAGITTAQGDVAANAALARGQAQSTLFGNIGGAIGTAIGEIDFGGNAPPPVVGSADSGGF